MDIVPRSNLKQFVGPWKLGRAEVIDTQQFGIPSHLRGLSMERTLSSYWVTVSSKSVCVVCLILLQLGFIVDVVANRHA